MIENGQSTGVKFRVNRIIMKFFHVLKINTLHDRAVQLILQCDCIPFLQVTLDSLHKTKAGKVASKTARETGQVNSRQPKKQNIVFFSQVGELGQQLQQKWRQFILNRQKRRQGP